MFKRTFTGARFGSLCLLALLITAVACSDSKTEQVEVEQDAGPDASMPVPKSSLRPVLERPPTNGLPADLRPPR